MLHIFEKSSRPPKESPVGTYRIDSVSIPEECDWDDYLPLEIRYIFARYPEHKERIRAVLSNGKAIGIRTVLRTPESLLRAIHTISVYSQRNYVLTWLPPLLRDKHLPKFTESDYQRAAEQGENLNAAVETILHDRLRFKKVVLIDEENLGITRDEQHLVAELSELIYPLAIDYSVFRVIADNANERTKIAQSIVKMLFVVGPIAHILEKFVAGVGKVFAASMDDLLGESAELMALRGSGFTWRELVKRSRILVPVFLLATYGAFSVEGLIEEGRILLGGAVFGLSAVALSLTTAVQSIFMYRKNAALLATEGKMRSDGARGLTRTAFRQDFTNPARLGLLLGASLAPFLGMLGALLHLMHNGWVLALIGSTESIVAGATVLLADRVNEWRFRRRLRLSVRAHRRRRE